MARSLPSVLHTTPSTAALPSDQSRWIFQWQNGKLHLGGNCPVLATSNVLANGDLLTTDAAAVPPMRLKPSGGRQFLEKSMCYLLELNLIMSSAIISYSNRFQMMSFSTQILFFHPKRLVGSDFFASNIFQINVSPYRDLLKSRSLLKAIHHYHPSFFFSNFENRKKRRNAPCFTSRLPWFMENPLLVHQFFRACKLLGVPQPGPTRPGFGESSNTH